MNGFERVKNVIDRYRLERGLSLAELSAKAKISPATMSRRMADPSAFTVGEVRSIFRALEVPEEDRRVIW